MTKTATTSRQTWAESVDKVLLKEFTIVETDTAGLTALSQFLTARASDEDSQKVISVDAFLALANDMGIPMTRSQLLDVVDEEPLSNLIDNVEGDQIMFKGARPVDTDMSVSKAQDVVGKMSKRALNKRD